MKEPLRCMSRQSSATLPYISHTHNTRITRLPKSLNGSDLVIEQVCGSSILVCDSLPQAQLDDLSEDTCVLLGPCSGSVFVRDCSDCTVKAVCAQLRACNCTNVRFELFCTTQPSIEQCKQLVFSYWRSAYPQLSSQLSQSGLDPNAPNLYSAVHIFDAKQQSDTFTIDSTCDGTFEIFRLDESNEASSLGPPECPLPLPDGSTLTSTASAAKEQQKIAHEADSKQPKESLFGRVCGIIQRLLWLDRGAARTEATRPGEGSSNRC